MTVEAPKIFPGWQNGRAQRWIWGAVLAVIVLTGAIRLRIAGMPLERDEGEYAYTGQLMLQGVPPYQGSYFMKLPGTHAMYALGMAIFGQTKAGIHRWLLAVNAGTIVLIFLLGRKLADPVAGLIACAAYAVMSLSPCVLGPVAHATQFLVLFATAGILVLCKAIESRKALIYFSSGMLLGLAVLMKQPGAFFAVFGGLIIIWSEWHARPMRWSLVLKRGMFYSSGVIVPYVVTCLILWRAGVFERFWFWTVTCVRSYGAALPLSTGLRNLVDYLLGDLDPSMVLWFLAIAAVICIRKDTEAGAARAIVPGLLIVSLAAVSQGMYFRAHYFIMLLPALALALGVGVSSMQRLILHAKPEGVLAGMPAKYMAAALLVVIVGQWKFFFVMSPDDACRRLYDPGEAFVEIVQIGDYIKGKSAPGDQIAIIGSEPQICFYAGRRSATGYIYTYDMMGNGPFATQMQQEMIRQVEAVRPRFLLFVNLADSWGGTPTPQMPIVDWKTRYCRDFYEQVGKMVCSTEKPPVFYWGTEAIATAPLRQECIDIFEKKEPAVNGSASR
jgi:hypothetical protein